MIHRARSVAFVAALALLLLAPLARADFEREFTLDGDRLILANLVGAITVEGSTGSNFVITVEVRGDDAAEDLIEFDTEEGDDARLSVLFPVGDHDEYVYPELGRGSRTEIRFRRQRRDGHRSLFRDFFDAVGRDKIRISGRGRGLEMWADIHVAVPAGKDVMVLNGAGEIDARELSGNEFVFDTQSGSILASGIEGNLLCDTGSGHVEVSAVRGDLVVDTGSGHVEVTDCEGDELVVDTGSGHVIVDGAKAKSVGIDTGSGRVQLAAIETEELNVDTGSGGVRADDVAADAASIDTGSGSVRLDLVRMGDGPYVIDTGSGGIQLRLPDDASATVSADAGSGGVDVDVEDITVHRLRRDSVDFDVGAGDARIELESGSGRIRITGR